MEQPIISIHNGSIFQQQTLVVSEVNIKIYKGEFVYLIGKTGSGKTTILRALYGDLPLAEGSGMVAGFDLKKLIWKKIPYLRRSLGIVFQDFQLLMDRTIADNLLFTLRATGWKDKNRIQERIEDVLTKVGLKTKDFKMPHELSGGEQQRVVIARALLNEPEVILADEPTGNLDPDTSYDTIALLRQISEEADTAVLMATHNYNIIEKFPARIIKCEGGKVFDAEQY